ncbi:MAG: PDZ domain-containing protein [Reyranella sp.]|jgi:carboxyl-terminal processing protease|nr:PDZ domain-containing protein [Reyranella sp.]
MEVLLIPFLRKALPRAVAALFASSLVVSCATSTESPQAAIAAGRNPQVAADVNLERVVLQAYRAIGDRHLYEPNFRTLTTETYRGFASGDPAMVLETSDNAFTVKREGREVLSRSTPADPSDGRAWGGMLAELMAGSLDASPALQHADRQTLIREAMTATTKQLDRNSRYADPDEARDNRFQRDGGGGVGITVERTDDKRIMIRATQDGSPAARAGIQVGDQVLSIDGESMIDRPLGDVVAKLRGSVGAPVTITVLRGQGAEYALSMKRARIIPTTVTYERRGDVALIHLTGFNSATTDNLKAAIDKARAELGKDMAGVIIDMRSNRGGLLDQAQTVSELFINNGTIFSTNGRHPDSKRTYKSVASGKTADMPIVVLMNGGSASAAEIVAAALQDRGRAVIVGTTSYGKGTVQTVVRLANEGELILTWSRLQAPSGYTWNEVGVLPNICTSKVADVGQVSNTTVDSSQSTLMRWHAMRNPTQQEVTDLRKICPPGDASPERDVEVAIRLLRDHALYAHAVQAATQQAAARQ